MPNLWLPGAEHNPIPQTTSDPLITPVGAVFHIAVSEASSLKGVFSDGRGIESTGYIRRDGSIEQYRPVNVECDAQSAGNSWFVNGVRVGLTSWESQGMGPGEWTPDQMDTIRFIINWHRTEWLCPGRVCPGPNMAGFGYHRLFDEWNPNRHSCPGDDRVKQFNNVLVPWFTNKGDEIDMATLAELRQLIREEVGRAKITVDPNTNPPTDWQLERVFRALLDDEEKVRAAVQANADKIVQTIVDAAPAEGTLSRAQFVNAVEIGVKNVLKGGTG